MDETRALERLLKRAQLDRCTMHTKEGKKRAFMLTLYAVERAGSESQFKFFVEPDDLREVCSLIEEGLSAAATGVNDE